MHHHLTQPSDLLPQVVSAVTTAAAMIRAEFHRPGGPRSPGPGKAHVDDEAEELLRASLLRLHPAGWRGEETGIVETRGSDVWVVDPQDGTSDFLKGLRGSAISVALLRGGRPVLGVVCAPTAPDDKGDLIAWAEGADLTRNGVRVRALAPGETPVIALNADAADYAAANHAALGGLRVRALPSPAYRLALAAAGEVDGAMSLIHGLSPWDIAGGHALLVGAGKTLVDLNGVEIDYTRRSFAGVIGGAPKIVRHLAAHPLKKAGVVPRKPARAARKTAGSSILCRAQGVLLGQFAGDALGSLVEFKPEDRIAAAYPRGVRELRAGGTWNTIAGQPTDDSEMALALARTLVAKEAWEAGAVGKAYVAWGKSGPFDIGGTTSQGLAAIQAGRAATSSSQANGALMRVSPIGVFAAGLPTVASNLAMRDAALTHPASTCQASNAAFAAAVAVGVAGADPEEMWAAAMAHTPDGDAGDTVRTTLCAARSELPKDFQSQMGWVRIALQNAFYWLLSGESLEEALVATVGKGGDTDTNAAIAGALLGAAHGRDAVPLRWRNAVLTARACDAPGIHRPRPAIYWPDDALDLAEALLAAGS